MGHFSPILSAICLGVLVIISEHTQLFKKGVRQFNTNKLFGRKEIAMPRKGNSLKHDLFIKASADVKNNQSRTNYKRSIRRFAQWAKAHQLKRLEDITEAVIQDYQEDLKADPKQYTPATIHTYLAPVCKGVGINLNRIRKEKRKSDTIVRGRLLESNAQGKHQEKNARFSRLVNFQKVVGIRRNELQDLKGRDFKQGKDGNYYVIVQRGKGGKRQEQLILPEDVDLVRSTFQSIPEDESVFSADEMANQINLHKMRACHARDSYFYYLEKLNTDPDYEVDLMKLLLDKWDEGHKDIKDESLKSFQKRRLKFIHEMRDEPYLLRGPNKKKALASGMPLAYNRLALMAVSVLNLSHWRTGVAVTNYILQ